MKMNKDGLRCMADGGMIGSIKAMMGKREKVLDEAERSATGLRQPAPTPTPAAPVQKPITVNEAESKMARFKFERENPGVPYVPPKMNDGGMITGKGGPTDDEQPIMASPGEFVLPADTVKQVGAVNLRRLIDDTHTPVPGVRGMADGGPVRKIKTYANSASFPDPVDVEGEMEALPLPSVANFNPGRAPAPGDTGIFRSPFGPPTTPGNFADQNDRKMMQGVRLTPPGSPATGDFRDQNDRKLMQGRVLPLEDGTVKPLPTGTGIVSNGARQMTVNAPGMPDTIGAANAAARTEMQAMDMRNENENAGLRRQWDTERAQKDANYALYERDAAKTGTDAIFGGKKLKQANFEVAQAQKAMEGLRTGQVDVDKNRTFTEAMKYGQDQGLRGITYKADRDKEGDIYKADGAFASATMKAQADAAKAALEQQGKNREDFGKWGTTRFNKPEINADGKPTGKTVHDPDALAAFKEDVLVEAYKNPAFLKQFGVKSVDDLTTTDWEKIHSDTAARRGIVNNVNASADSGDQKISGVGVRAGVRGTRFGDFVNSSTDNTQNSISFGQALAGATNFASDPAGNMTVTMVGRDGKAQNRMLSDVAKDPKEMAALIDIVAQTDPEKAKELRAMFSPPVAGLRK